MGGSGEGGGGGGGGSLADVISLPYALPITSCAATEWSSSVD